MAICAFIGHRNIEEKDELKEVLTEIITALIEDGDSYTFLFGSKSAFDDVCLETVTELKKVYPQIKRVYVRAINEKVPDFYSDYLLKDYEESFFPAEVSGAGYRSYVKRNQVMIDMCDILITYYDKDYQPTGRSRISKKSGTGLAVEYANKKNKEIINVFEIIEECKMYYITEKDVEFLRSKGVETDLKTLRKGGKNRKPI